MDFNAIYEVVQPYIGTGAMATAIITVLTIAFKVFSLIKEARRSFSSTHNEAVEVFKKALPKELYVSLESLTKSELAKITQTILEAVDKNWLAQIRENTELMQAIANAMLSMKAVPDSAKEKISELLDVKAETTESLKLELLPDKNEVEVSTTTKSKTIDISID